MPFFTTFDDPVFDLGGKGNTTSPPRWKRPILAALICSLKGHNWQLVGYANAHKFQWTQWQIGEYRGANAVTSAALISLPKSSSMKCSVWNANAGKRTSPKRAPKIRS